MENKQRTHLFPLTNICSFPLLNLEFTDLSGKRDRDGQVSYFPGRWDGNSVEQPPDDTPSDPPWALCSQLWHQG